MPTYTTNAGWHGDRRRGAALGRPNQDATASDASFKFQLTRVRLNQGGYDSGGAYWGLGQPLYAYVAAEPIDGELPNGYLRATDRQHAKDQIMADYPNARFFR